MATTHISNPIKTGNSLCTLEGDKVLWNRPAIMRRAWAHLRHEQKMAKRPSPFGSPILPPMTFAECLKEAWNHAHSMARDLDYAREVQAMTPERRTVLTLEAQTRLGPRGWEALDNARRACVAAAA